MNRGLHWAYLMLKKLFRKYFRYAQMTLFIFETITEFSAAIRNVNVQLVLMNRGLTYNANLNATMAPADLFVPRGTRVLVGYIVEDQTRIKIYFRSWILCS